MPSRYLALSKADCVSFSLVSADVVPIVEQPCSWAKNGFDFKIQTGNDPQSTAKVMQGNRIVFCKRKGKMRTLIVGISQEAAADASPR